MGIFINIVFLLLGAMMAAIMIHKLWRDNADCLSAVGSNEQWFKVVHLEFFNGKMAADYHEFLKQKGIEHEVKFK